MPRTAAVGMKGRPAAKAERPLFLGEATFAGASSSDADGPTADLCVIISGGLVRPRVDIVATGGPKLLSSKR
jgi:hypothetical protein